MWKCWERIYTCVCARVGKKFKLERLKYTYAKMFTPRICARPTPKGYTGIYMLMYIHIYTHLMVYTEECLGMEHSSLPPVESAAEAVMFDGRHISYSDRCTFFLEAHCTLHPLQGILKLPLSSTRKVKTSIKNNILKSMKKRFH